MAIVGITQTVEFLRLPIKVIIRCPAEILAIRRTVRVRGRINPLINSINTIMGTKIIGVPTGTR